MTLTLPMSRQVHYSGSMQWWACSSLNPLLCLQRQVAKLGSELFYSWPLLRDNNMVTNTRRCNSNYGSRRFATCRAVWPTLRFSREFGLVFCGVAFFKVLRAACFWASFIWHLLFFWVFFFTDLCSADCFFFQILWHCWSFNLLLRTIWACFSGNLLFLGLFLLMCLLAFLFNFPADFFFCWIFLPNPCWACFSVKLPILGFLSNYLLVFAKQRSITDVQQLLNADILAGNAARQWLLIAVSHVGLYQWWANCGSRTYFVWLF